MYMQSVMLSKQGPKCKLFCNDRLSKAAIVNVSRMSPKLLITQPHIVENQGITMAPLFLSLTS